MFDQHVYVDGPDVSAFGITVECALKKSLGMVWVPKLELKLSKLGNHIHICKEKRHLLASEDNENQPSLPRNTSSVHEGREERRYRGRTAQVFEGRGRVLTFFDWQPLEGTFQEPVCGLGLASFQEEGGVLQPHRFLLTEALQHRVVQVFGLLGKYKGGRRGQSHS